ncbi:MULTISPECIES: hypothetical protein [Clostridium]|uniref:hypothetical protein n=1 Tax=Clostridium TaxID=1485 RepID=UPI001898F537|nr:MULTISPECIES: hypothetical protein [Clostridium]MCR1950269.1 hypothetical protein [Clostridium sp. DSM 100503]MDI9219271.1 hypothetical protein [Clostridium tertium]
MFIMQDIMQKVVVKNLTNDIITNIKLTHDGEWNGNHKEVIKKLKSNESREVSLYTQKVNNRCNLILTYTYKDISNTVVAYDKLSGKDLRLITLEIKEIDEKIVVNTTLNNELWT